MSSKMKWTVEFEVDLSWVADGFVLTDDVAREMIEQRLGWAYSHELEARVIAGPSAARIAKIQGYGRDVLRFLDSGPYEVRAGVVQEKE